MDALQITKLLTNSKTVVGAINELYNKIKTSNGGIFYVGQINKDSSSEEILQAIGGNWDTFIEKINGDYILLYRPEESLNRMPLFWSYESGSEVYITFYDSHDKNTFKFVELCITKTGETYSCEETEYNTLVGDTTKLQTTNKNVIEAINELYNSISAQTGVYRISELTDGMQSENISSAIGGWDNLIEAINDKRTILMYSGSTVYQAVYYSNVTTTTNLKFIIPITGNTNSQLNYVNISISNISSNLTVNRTQTPINTEDITKLQTDTKNLVGAINELNGKIGSTDGLPYVIIKPNSYSLLQSLWYKAGEMNNTDILNLFGIETSASDANQQLFNLVSSLKNKSLILFKQKDDDDSPSIIAASALGLIANLDVAETSLKLTLNIITGSENGNDDKPIACNILFQINTTSASVDTIYGGNILTNNNYQTLKTTNKKIIEAINEINAKLINLIPVVELTTQINFSLNDTDIELSAEELSSLLEVKDSNQIALSFKSSTPESSYKVYSVFKYSTTTGTTTLFTFNLSDNSIVGYNPINYSFILTLRVSRAAIKIVNLNIVYPILLENLNNISPTITGVQNAIGQFNEIKNAIDMGKNIIALDDYNTYKENIKILYTKATSDYILIGVIISNEDFPVNGFIYRIYKILNNYNISVSNIPVHKAIEFENLKSITDADKANTIIGKYTMEEIIFAQANGIPFINKYDVAGSTSKDRIISVATGNATVVFVYFDNPTNKFYKLVLTYETETKRYKFVSNQSITN